MLPELLPAEIFDTLLPVLYTIFSCCILPLYVELYVYVVPLQLPLAPLEGIPVAVIVGRATVALFIVMDDVVDVPLENVYPPLQVNVIVAEPALVATILLPLCVKPVLFDDTVK